MTRKWCHRHRELERARRAKKIQPRRKIIVTNIPFSPTEVSPKGRKASRNQ